MDIVTEDLWHFLKGTDKPIYIYGMGDGANKIISVLNKNSIPIKGIYANDEYVRGHFFNGFKVMKFSEVKACEENGFISLLAFATEREPLLSFLYNRSEETQMYAPDVPVVPTYDENGNIEVFDLEYFKLHEAEFNSVYNALADDLSRQTLQNVINFKLTGKVAYLKAVTSPKDEAYRLLKNALTDKSCLNYLDLGAFTGDTFFEFRNYFSVENAYLVEPDTKSYKRLTENTATCSIDKNCKITAVNAAAWSEKTALFIDDKKGGRSTALSKTAKKQIEAISVDGLLNGEFADVIKLDVEGAEREALIGAEKTIKKDKPKLMVSAYHKNEDLFSLFFQITKLNPTYKAYLRHHPYIPAWETCFYFM